MIQDIRLGRSDVYQSREFHQKCVEASFDIIMVCILNLARIVSHIYMCLNSCRSVSGLSRSSLSSWASCAERNTSKNCGNQESGEREPRESAGSLEQSALVGRSIEERLVDIIIIAARVHS